MNDPSMDETRQQPTRIRRIVAAIVWIALVGMLSMWLSRVAFGNAQYWSWMLHGRFGWGLLCVAPALLLGFLVAWFYKGNIFVGRVALMWVVTVLAAILILACDLASVSVSFGGIPPRPGETMRTPIGWFTPRFWKWMRPGSHWILLSIIPYIAGVVIGRLLALWRRRVASKISADG